MGLLLVLPGLECLYEPCCASTVMHAGFLQPKSRMPTKVAPGWYFRSALFLARVNMRPAQTARGSSALFRRLRCLNNHRSESHQWAGPPNGESYPFGLPLLRPAAGGAARAPGERDSGGVPPAPRAALARRAGGALGGMGREVGRGRAGSL